MANMDKSPNSSLNAKNKVIPVLTIHITNKTDIKIA